MLKKLVLGFLIFLVFAFIWDRIAKTFLEDKEFEFSSQVIDAIYANPSYARIGDLQAFELRFDSSTMHGSDSVRFRIDVQGRDSTATFVGMCVRQLKDWRVAELKVSK